MGMSFAHISTPAFSISKVTQAHMDMENQNPSQLKG